MKNVFRTSLVFSAAVALSAAGSAAAPLCDKLSDDQCMQAIYDQLRARCTSSTTNRCPGELTDSASQFVFASRVCPGGGKEACDAFVELAKRVAVIDYDAAGHRWNLGRQAEWDANGNPTIEVDRDEPVVVRIRNSNALLYAVDPGDVTVGKAENLESLQKFFGFAGKYVQALTVAQNAFVPLKLPKPKGPQLMTFIDQRNRELEALNTYFTGRKAGVEEFRSALGAATAAVDALSTQNAAVSDFIQRVELGDSTAVYRFRANPGAATAALDKLATSARLIAPDGCAPLVHAFLGVIDADEDDLAKAKRDFESERALEMCRGEAEAIGKLYDAYLAARVAADSTSQQFAAGVSRLIAQLDNVLTLQEKLSEEVEKVVKERGEVAKSEARVNFFENRLAKYLASPATEQNCGGETSGVPCAIAAQLLDLAVPGRLVRVSWDEVETRPFTIKADSPYAGEIEKAQSGEVTAQYTVGRSSTKRWSVAAALTHSPLEEVEYEAVATEVEGESVIRETSRSRRTGDIALFLRYDLLKNGIFRDEVRSSPIADILGLELGFGVKDEPALFFGPSFALGRYVRVGGGYTLQQLNVLDGQEVDDVLSKGETIRTRDRFDSDWYLALSVNIGALGLFSAE